MSPHSTPSKTLLITKDSDVEAESVKMVPGGSALNQGRHLHALGMQVRFVGAAGCSEIEVRTYQTMINDKRHVQLYSAAASTFQSAI